jgi:aspartyl-tRNA(Asn)/glutamyl-tRNA(Gln) amidotransferase subunit A
MKEKIHLLSAIELRNAFLEGHLRATDIVRHFLRRIDRHNKTLGAFLTILEEKALVKAEALDRKRTHNKPLGKLAAIPIAIKDNMHIAGEITTCGSKFLKNYRAPFDATAIQLLEEEDAILIGKTNLDEFAMGSSNENSAFFPAHNPWNLQCVPGGSSGGSAAAVAAGLSLLATGSDTGGSIRQPAGFCGVVGFKPTYGRVSRFGLVAFGSSLDQIGPLSKTAADAGLAMEVIGRHSPRDSTSLPLPPESYLDTLDSIELRETRFGVPWNFLKDLKQEARSNFSASIDVLKSLGASVTEVNLDICKYSIAVYYILATAEASTNLARFDGIRYGVRSQEAQTLDEVYDLSRDEGFGPEVKKRIMLGTFVLSAGYQDAYYKKAQKVRTRIIDAFETAFAGCDAILLPVSPRTAFPLNSIHDPIEMYLQDIFTIPANLAGLPAISIPSGFDRSGLPFGLQIIGPQMHDVPVIQYGHAFETATRFTRKIPPAFEES